MKLKDEIAMMWWQSFLWDFTEEQQHEWENAAKIGEILSSTVNTMDSTQVRVNRKILEEAVAIYHTIGYRKSFLEGNEQFVKNCLLYTSGTFAACSRRIILCYGDLTSRDVVYWYGNGRVKDPELVWWKSDNSGDLFFVGDNRFMIAYILINRAIYARLQKFLTPQG
jgi:hypothetical protein